MVAFLGVLPLIVTVVESFRTWQDMRVVGFGSLEGYRELLRSDRVHSLGHVVVRSLVTASLCVTLAIPVSYFISRLKRPSLRNGFLLLLTVPFLISEVARAFGWFHLLSADGTINRTWRNLTNGLPLRLALNDQAVLLATVSSTISLAIFPASLALPRRDDSIWRAADELGLPPLIRLFRLVVPLALPGLVVGWFCAFWAGIAASVEDSVLGGPMSLSYHRLMGDLRAANRFSAAFALATLTVAGCAALAALFLVAMRLRPRAVSAIEAGITAAARVIPESAVVWGDAVRRWYVGSPLRLRVPRRLATGLVALCAIASLALVLAPVISVLILAITRVRGTPSAPAGMAYGGLLSDPSVVEAWTNSLKVAAVAGAISAVFAFVCGLTWWDRRWRTVTFSALAMLAVLPPDAAALGLLHVDKWLGLNIPSYVLLVMSHVTWALPFCTAATFAVNSRIEPTVLRAALEFDSSRLSVARRVILPACWPGVLSALVIGFLMSVNEYTRTSYLCGANQMLSRYSYARLQSSSDPTVYAIGGVNLVVGALTALTLMFLTRIIPASSR